MISKIASGKIKQDTFTIFFNKNLEFLVFFRYNQRIANLIYKIQRQLSCFILPLAILLIIVFFEGTKCLSFSLSLSDRREHREAILPIIVMKCLELYTHRITTITRLRNRIQNICDPWMLTRNIVAINKMLASRRKRRNQNIVL
jgi:hypothetical protein